jgi:hypothetical protein
MLSSYVFEATSISLRTSSRSGSNGMFFRSTVIVKAFNLIGSSLMIIFVRSYTSSVIVLLLRLSIFVINKGLPTNNNRLALLF